MDGGSQIPAATTETRWGRHQRAVCRRDLRPGGGGRCTSQTTSCLPSSPGPLHCPLFLFVWCFAGDFESTSIRVLACIASAVVGNWTRRAKKRHGAREKGVPFLRFNLQLAAAEPSVCNRLSDFGPQPCHGVFQASSSQVASCRARLICIEKACLSSGLLTPRGSCATKPCGCLLDNGASRPPRGR